MCQEVHEVSLLTLKGPTKKNEVARQFKTQTKITHISMAFPPEFHKHQTETAKFTHNNCDGNAKLRAMKIALFLLPKRSPGQQAASGI